MSKPRRGGRKGPKKPSAKVLNFEWEAGARRALSDDEFEATRNYRHVSEAQAALHDAQSHLTGQWRVTRKFLDALKHALKVAERRPV